MPVPQVRLTGRAARFVFLLRDFGHIDESGVDRLMLGASDLRDVDAVGPLTLQDVRRAAAVMVFSEQEEQMGKGLLAADWPILFS
jgi:hypothetical protein